MKLEPGDQGPPRDAVSGLPYADLVRRIAGKGAGAWELHFRGREMEKAGRDVIFLTVGDPDFDTPPAIAEASFAAVRAGRTHYTPVAGIPELRAAAARFETGLLGRPVAAETIVVCPGAQYALFSALQCLAGPGDEVVLLDPAYATFEGTVRATGADIVHVSLARGRDFGFDPARLEAALTARTRAVVLNFPHNPTGRTLAPQDIDALARMLEGRDVWLLSDEVYYSLCYDGPFVSPAAHPSLADRTVVLRSLSKSHAMSGWRIGWAVAPGALAGHMEVLSTCVLYGLPHFIQDAAVFALEAELDEVEAMKAAYRVRRDFVVERIAGLPGLACIRPEAGIFCMIDVTGTGLGDQDFAARLLEAEAVSLLPAGSFGPSGEGFVRLSLTAPRARLAEALDRVERFLKALK